MKAAAKKAFSQLSIRAPRQGGSDAQPSDGPATATGSPSSRRLQIPILSDLARRRKKTASPLSADAATPAATPMEMTSIAPRLPSPVAADSQWSTHLPAQAASEAGAATSLAGSPSGKSSSDEALELEADALVRHFALRIGDEPGKARRFADKLISGDLGKNERNAVIEHPTMLIGGAATLLAVTRALERVLMEQPGHPLALSVFIRLHLQCLDHGKAAARRRSMADLARLVYNESTPPGVKSQLLHRLGDERVDRLVDYLPQAPARPLRRAPVKHWGPPRIPAALTPLPPTERKRLLRKQRAQQPKGGGRINELPFEILQAFTSFGSVHDALNFSSTSRRMRAATFPVLARERWAAVNSIRGRQQRGPMMRQEDGQRAVHELRSARNWEALNEAMDRGFSFSMPPEQRLALVRLVPHTLQRSAQAQTPLDLTPLQKLLVCERLLGEANRIRLGDLEEIGRMGRVLDEIEPLLQQIRDDDPDRAERSMEFWKAEETFYDLDHRVTGLQALAAAEVEVPPSAEGVEPELGETRLHDIQEITRRVASVDDAGDFLKWSGHLAERDPVARCRPFVALCNRLADIQVGFRERDALTLAQNMLSLGEQLSRDLGQRGDADQLMQEPLLALNALLGSLIGSTTTSAEFVRLAREQVLRGLISTHCQGPQSSRTLFKLLRDCGKSEHTEEQDWTHTEAYRALRDAPDFAGDQLAALQFALNAALLLTGPNGLKQYEGDRQVTAAQECLQQLAEFLDEAELALGEHQLLLRAFRDLERLSTPLS